MAGSEREPGDASKTVAARPQSGDSLPTVREGTATPATRDLAAAISAFDPPDDRFTSVGELGRGGMGRVVDAIDRALDRPVAVKHMLSTTPTDLARFEREARITARLEHPGIVPIHDVGRSEDGTPFYVMRKVDGRPLDQLVEGRDLTERLAMVPNVLAVCDAVAFAHARHVIHRDIKPTNILIGPFGETLLIDWGLARTIGDTDATAEVPISEPNLTRAGVVAGTPGFMAPEQARGEHVDERADVYALGATLFYVLSGKLPFAGTSATEMIELVGHNRPPQWSALPGEVPADLRAILVKAMAPELGVRYRDGSALAADLRRFVTGKLVGAYRYGFAEQLWRFVRKHRAAIAVGAIAALVLALGAVISVTRILHERDDANAARELAEVQRREAIDKSDELLVEHARQLADLDPAAAIAVLRRLPAESKHWAAAAAIAAAAATRGIPWGMSTNSTAFQVELADDSRHLAVITLDLGHVFVVDLVAHERREVGAVPGGFDVTWLDHGRWLAIAGGSTVTLMDTLTGQAKTVTAPTKVRDVSSARTGGGWILLDSGALYALGLETTTLGPPILEGVDDVAVVGPERLVIRRRTALELWTPRRTWPLLDAKGRASWIASMSDDRTVSAISEDQLCLWRVTDVPTIVMCRPLDPALHLVPFGFSTDGIYALSSDGVVEITATAIRSARRGSFEATSWAQRGFLAAAHDGSIEVVSAKGSFEIGRRQTTYRRLLVTPDERFIVAQTTTGELLWWDVDTFRPREFVMPRRELLATVTATSIWTLAPAESLNRYDQTTGAQTGRFEAGGIAASPAGDGTWIQLNAMIGGDQHLFDTTSERTIDAAPGERFAISRDNTVLAVGADGTIAAVDRTGARRNVTRLPGKIAIATVSADHAVALLEDDRLCQVALASGQPTCIQLTGNVEDLALATGGRVWIVVDGELVRWDPGSPLVAVATPQRIRSLSTGQGRTLAHGITLLADLDTDPPTLVNTGPLALIMATTHDRVIGISPQHELAIVDVETGVTYTLPRPEAVDLSMVVSDGLRVAAAGLGSRTDGQRRVELWTFTVPREPAALRAWLASVTNARPVPNSDLVVWP